MTSPVLRVALDVPLPRGFDYLAPGAQESDVGRRVCVPFGRGEKIGVILEMLAVSELPPEKLKPVRDILRDMPPLPPDWLALADFCSGYYQHPVGEVMALALPPALRRRNVLPRLPDRNLFRITEEGRRALPSLMQRSIAARLLAALESNGAMTRDEAERSPYRNAITKGIGVDETLDPGTIVRTALVPGDVLLLCSDGLYRLVPPGVIADTLAAYGPDEAGHRLVALANEGGGTDNISMAIFRRE